MPDDSAILIAAILGQYVFLIRISIQNGRFHEWKRMMDQWWAMVEEWRAMVDKKIWSVSE